MEAGARIGRTENIAGIAAFLLAITLPLGRLLVGGDSGTESTEARRLAPRPPLVLEREQLGSFPAKFDAYFADHFGFRALLLQSGNILKSQWLGVSPSPDVVIGEQGWLYYAGNKTFDSFRGARQLTESELEGWRRSLERRRDWLAERGVRYFFAVVAEKQSVYPEFVPARYGHISDRTPTTQLVEYIQAHSQIELIDLRGPVQRAKAGEPVFYRLDTHWNPWGAFAAYQELLTSIAKSLPEAQPRLRSHFRAINPRQQGGDLARIAGLRTTEEVFELVPEPQISSPRQPLTIAGLDVAESLRPFATETNDQPRPRAVMVHDSFAYALFPLLSENFSRIVYLRRTVLNSAGFEQVIAATVASERPDVFIEEMAERHVVIVPQEAILFGGNAAVLPALRAFPATNALAAPPGRPRSLGAKYAIGWLTNDVPRLMAPGSTTAVHIQVTNTGDWTWPDKPTANPANPDGSYAVRLGYRWGSRDKPAPRDTGIRGDLPTPLAPDETATIDLTLIAPSEPGEYELQLDLVEELVAWFSQKGAPPLTLLVTVR